MFGLVRDISRSKVTHKILTPENPKDNRDVSRRWKSENSECLRANILTKE